MIIKLLFASHLTVANKSIFLRTVGVYSWVLPITAKLKMHRDKIQERIRLG